MSPDERIPFNRPYVTGRELDAIAEAVDRSHLSPDGHFTALCLERLRELFPHSTPLLVHSCTAALELSALLLDLAPGDEVIMPSYTFVTTASAFALRGATPVFVDIRPDTLNIDETLVEDAITEATRAIIPVHYAGVGCDLDVLGEIASAHGLPIVEDAAQGLHASIDGTPLGTMGSLGAISFHETKNVTCGQGGVLLVNDERLRGRAEVLRDKGTNRGVFQAGLVDKYTWVDVGSSFALSDMAAAFLWPQLQESLAITEARRRLWERYHESLAEAENEGLLRRQVTPEGREHNAHMYYLLLPDGPTRDWLIDELEAVGINSVFHYVPLHSSPAGRAYGRTHGSLQVTDDLSARLLRLPLWTGMSPEMVDRVVDAVIRVLARGRAPASRSFARATQRG